MIKLGVCTTKDGKRYDCNFYLDDKRAEAIGPLPKDQHGARGIATEVFAENEEEAKIKLGQRLDCSFT